MPAARRLATVATLAVVTFVGGCSDEPEPRFAEPSESAAATDSPSVEDADKDVRDDERGYRLAVREDGHIVDKSSNPLIFERNPCSAWLLRVVAAEHGR